ncbi:(2Fe-2S)-binding protein [Pandoraea apista]|uniref:(2Fe-2S)-binding domain-containing protein n=1 Tax=Pandoraea apista TaxID=93218 RepID=A0A0G4JA66_9BURK|nr:(2Fe-2S)-binding protein [Pandoraea apista]ALS67379.1 (2Fe-2S)-binding protein [Pandoraea apista]AVF41899.1 (2Fe-2S)-binding protein [Pandoraea apista]OXS97646.1 (2Fe-2S)-binding protein [Pandoraea apista]PTD99332.1 (2Fe-2S)-binding protein [Pandoraea apista]RRJ29362.1 (2Fe-2S)-binding protein [Pandoraea apista]
MTDVSSAPQAASDATATTGAGQDMSGASAASAAATPASASGKKPWETLPVTVKVNGVSHGPMDVPAGLMMIDFLHETLGLTGSRLGCGQGICHACVVIVDHADGSSETVRTCITGANYFDGKTVRTVEGHATRDADGKLTLAPIQQAFLDHFSFQCGYCTPGFVNAATVLIEGLKRNPVARADLEAAITAGLNDQICRCTGYVRYYEAVRDVILQTPGCIKDAK